MADSFLGLDATAWTALGTLSALAIAVGGAIAAPLSGWISRKWFGPKLSLRIEDAVRFSSSLDNGNSFWIRIPVQNERPSSAAEKVEVFLERATVISDHGREPLDHFLPMRLTWTYTNNGAVCDRITGETYKLIDVGVLLPKGVCETNGSQTTLVAPPIWRFTGEVFAHAPTALPFGSIEVSVIISAEHVAPRRQLFRIVFDSVLGTPSVRAEKC